MSPARATLLHSPGWNEGKARYETLGTRKMKSYMSSVGAALTAHTFGLYRCGDAVGGVPLLKELKKWVSMPNPGLAPWAMKKYCPIGALR